MLILNDFVPINGHDPDRIIGQLKEVMEKQKCDSLLLDFQRESDETAALARAITEELPWPVGVSELFAEPLNCPVFLPPVPPDTLPEDYLKPWQNREIWLEAAMDGSVIVLTADGSSSAPLPHYEIPTGSHRDAYLHCHYSIDLHNEQAKFTLFRTPEDLSELLEEATSRGVTNAIGLWQELGNI